VAEGASEWGPRVKKALVFRETPVYWKDWVQTWQGDHDGQSHLPLLPKDIHLLRR
jgi:hypothetical protein